MKTVVRAAEIATLLDDAPDGVRVLSLDCFDTLLWRNCQMPMDVFADLPIDGGRIESRGYAEAFERNAMLFREGRSEVALEPVYRTLYPNAPEAEIAAAVAAEIDAEARHCFGFAPVQALIDAARARGLTVIVVSDTYLSSAQLRELIVRAAGEATANAIDRIFASSEYKRSKSQGLFKDVLAELGLEPETIVHLGDNRHADHDAARTLGIQGVHFRQFDIETEQRLRLEATAAVLIDPSTRVSAPCYQPQRPALSLRAADDAEYRLGHDVLGPIMQGFAAWVRDEATALREAAGRPVKILFLLRDGHLPKLAFDALGGGEELDGRAVSISRFTATVASFRDAAAVNAFMVRSSRWPTHALANQLLLSDGELAKIVRNRPHKSSGAALRSAVRTPQLMNRILGRARRFTDRLCAHLRAEGGVEKGDAIMFVDLGYAGTVQNLVAATLGERMDVTVHGRYLLYREQQRFGYDKRGLLDLRHYDYKALFALSESIAVVEQLATVAEGSVVDYTADGAVIRKSAGIKGRQSEVRDRVQAACVAFAREARHAVRRHAASDGPEAQRRMVAATLARLLFLPSAGEVKLLEAFDHDVNLGTDQTVKLLDAEDSAVGLRRRGLSYVREAQRLFLPGELREHGLPLSLSLFSARRFGLDLKQQDFDVGTCKLPVMLADATSQTIVEFDAHPTAEGFMIATIPVGAARLSLGIQFGRLFDWVQIEEASFHEVEHFRHFKAGAGNEGMAAQPIVRGMEEAAPGLYRCDPAGFYFTPPPPNAGDAMLMLAIVFRPILRRGAAVAEQARAA